ncbi:MAG TPA: hypothetical protein VGJ66_00085 [Pyrinomonadaceae bacterium]|jgi:hypothetical protein
MSVTTLDQEESLGIFELDDDGIVIYSSFEESNRWVGAEKDIRGRDFFNEVLAFTNVAELQRRLESFKAEGIPARSFDFVCHFHQQSVTVKVLLARLCDKFDGRPKSVLVHLRRSSAATAEPTANGHRF